MATEFRPRRFIAGAVCPKCAEMDKTVMYRVSDTEQKRECVRCGHTETIHDEAPATAEPATRVNQPRVGEEALPHEDEVRVVSIIDPRDGASRRDH
ncbi:MAG: YheV family putative zinc ribbon protein [Spongiibacter sp.]|uniref:YheV family putative metal-binding protein n=1 Tax=Spongiibacter thalassae TaxID=2721624 RepID=A0ABX1GHA9_9GAMM|nr:YheV family putative zinc ribbon protein [Spongiibacter thalassae]NKI18326.1 YheV family putative metal-binding protein [Spongiibacter thalassae]